MHQNAPNDAILRRFPRYYRVIRTLLQAGIYRCSSEEIARRCGYAASSVRADLRRFAGCAKQGYGYQLSKLYPAIGEYLGVNDRFCAVLVSEGALRDILCAQPIFSVHGIRLLAAFSSDLDGKESAQTPILPRSLLSSFCREKGVTLLLTTEILSEEEWSACKASGIKGIWNLSPAELSPIDGVKLSQIHPLDTLMQLCCELNQESTEQEGNAP